MLARARTYVRACVCACVCACVLLINLFAHSEECFRPFYTNKTNWFVAFILNPKPETLNPKLMWQLGP